MIDGIKEFGFATKKIVKWFKNQYTLDYISQQLKTIIRSHQWTKANLNIKRKKQSERKKWSERELKDLKVGLRTHGKDFTKLTDCI